MILTDHSQTTKNRLAVTKEREIRLLPQPQKGCFDRLFNSIDNLAKQYIIKIDNMNNMAKGRDDMSAVLAFAATEAKQKFGEMMDAAQSGPVVINKSGRPRAVMVSFEAYNKLQEYEDRYWAAKADEGLKSGFLGPEATMKSLQKLLNG